MNIWRGRRRYSHETISLQTLLIIFLCLYGYLPSVRTEVVDTDRGSVRGLTWSVSGVEDLAVFLGIPFTQPPLGELRFRPPVPRAAWRPAEWNATYFRPVCPQDLVHFRFFSFGDAFNDTAEDCLYLNIYTPRSALGNGSLPVIVWIHGGGYVYGAGSEYPGHVLASRFGVVVVTPNYRLGVLGFLSTESDVARGNYGLLDQIEALKWVKRNIARFGGDPDKVVIIGESAGGGSVSLLQFSPLAQGLFRGVVIQSGNALGPWAVYRHPYSLRNSTLSLSDQLNCSAASDVDMVSCLRRESVASLLSVTIDNPPILASWAPSVDGYVFLDYPERLLGKGLFHRLPVMTGTVKDEAAFELYFEIPGVEAGINASHYRTLIREWSQRYRDRAAVAERILLRAYPVSRDPAVNRNNYKNLRSDFWYIAPTVRLADKYSRFNQSLWMYSFQYLPENNTLASWMGVPHAEELYYLFGAPLWNGSCPGGCPQRWIDHQNWTLAEEEMSKNVMTLWTNFAKNLDPNPVPQFNQTWIPYKKRQSTQLRPRRPEKAYLAIGREMRLGTNLEGRRMLFNNYLLPRVVNSLPHGG